jgi:hypothetical protein
MKSMRRASRFLLALVPLFCHLCIASRSTAQEANGSIELTARVSPTAARPEPVRQVTFYILTKSYMDILKDVEAEQAPPSREHFIDGLKVSLELKEWLKSHEVFDLTAPDLDQLVTADDVLNIPEYLLAYQRSNSGGVTKGVPRPKYVEADKTANPERYQKQKDEYFAALKKFIQAHPESVNGIELELEGVNPQRKWAQLTTEHTKKVMQMAPEVAQTKYLAAQIDTDLDGHASVSNLPVGAYWISTLNLDVGAGDTRVRWDVPVSIRSGRTTRIELTNLNATRAGTTTR